jgi:NitT/TauT family transport system permease protein
MRRFRFNQILLPTLATVVLIAIWQVATEWLGIPSYLIPSPLKVLSALQSGLIQGTLWPHIWATFSAFLLGYLAGCIGALALAAIISEVSWLEQATYPLIVAFQAIPKVALAPVIIVWFGFGIESKIVMVGLICFFPCFLNALVGLKSHNHNLVDLYRAFGASRRQIFLSVKLPSAATTIFAGLEISVVLALLGVVMSELVASRAGLGHVIAAAGADFNVAMMFACIIILSVMGVLAAMLIAAVRRRVVFWERAGASSLTNR